MKILAILPEAHGGFGGIATYGRDLINACCELPRVESIKLLPRHLRSTPDGLPGKVDLSMAASNGLLPFLGEVLKAAAERFDLIICGHVYLLPFAKIARLARQTPVVCMLYGVEAWQPTRRLFVDRLSRMCAGWIAISEFTSSRFQGWSDIGEDYIGVLPNAIDTGPYGIGPKPTYLAERYGLEGKRVILTVGRLDARERQKGIDELIDLLPSLSTEIPEVAYLIAGDGEDRSRLEAKVNAAGLSERVKFAGRISEEEKADHYRLCDVYSMAGRQEGFGFVFLEALATGAPVVASTLDGSRDAVLNGKLGELANPDDPDSLRKAIVRAMAKPRKVPELLDHFSFPNFVSRLDAILHRFAPSMETGDCRRGAGRPT